jgi:cell division septation protein DedD
VTKLTAIVKKPEDAERKETFEELLIASTTTRDLEKIKTVNNLEAEWIEDSAIYTKIPPIIKTQKNFQGGPASTKQRFAPGTEKISPERINWVPRKTNSQPMTPEPEALTLGQSKILTTVPADTTSIQKPSRSEPTQYTIQVGAYETEANAHQMVSNLLEKGYQAHIKPDTKNGAPLFKVHVAEFSDKKQALKLAEKFTTKENLSSFVTTAGSN